jgi:hypothetical protein
MLHLVTVCTHEDGWFAALRESAHRNGHHLTVLGWGLPWTGFSMRLRLMRDYLRTLPDAELVCFVDAYDVVMLVDASELRDRYARLAPGGQVLLGTENPLRDPIANFVKTTVFGTCGGPTALNAGAYMGSVAYMRRFIAVVHGADGDGADDQKALHAACARLTQEGLVIVDADGDVFFHATCIPAMPWKYFTGRCAFGLTPDLVNPRTGRRPAVLHAPGGLELGGVCALLGLPPGQRPRRVVWMLSNFWPELLLGVLVLGGIVAAAICAVRRLRRLRRRSGPVGVALPLHRGHLKLHGE